jgi:hypothetical protein
MLSISLFLWSSAVFLQMSFLPTIPTLYLSKSGFGSSLPRIPVVPCWLWSLIIFLIQRSLLSAVFIPHEVFTPQKYVHSSTRGSAEGGYPLCGVRGGYPPGWGVWGQAGPQRGFGGRGSGAKPPKQKLPCKSIL